MIQFLNLDTLNLKLSEQYDAIFDPETMSIYIDKNIRRKYPDMWVRQLIAIIVHEFIHILEFILVCKFDLNKWQNMNNSEQRAERIEFFFLKLMGITVVKEM